MRGCSKPRLAVAELVDPPSPRPPHSPPPWLAAASQKRRGEGRSTAKIKENEEKNGHTWGP